MMFRILKFSVITALIAIVSCKKDEVEPEVAIVINFANEDLTFIDPGDCLNPDLNYFIAVQAVSGVSEKRPRTINYLINGVPFELTLTNDVIEYIPVTLLEGVNTAEIEGEEASVTVNVVYQGDFELIR